MDPYGFGGDPVNGVDRDGRFLSLLTGAVRGLIQGKGNAWDRLKAAGSEAKRQFGNELKIYWGLVQYDSEKGFWNNAWRLTSRFTWEAPNTELGFTGAQFNNYAGNTRKVSYYHGATVVETKSRDWGGVTMGNYIHVERGASDLLIQHEYGHTIQSRTVGPFYLGVVAPASGLSALLDPDDHTDFWTERWADDESGDYFNEPDFHEKFTGGSLFHTESFNSKQLNLFQIEKDDKTVINTSPEEKIDLISGENIWIQE